MHTQQTTRKSRSYFHSPTTTSSLCRNQIMQFAMVRVTDQYLEMDVIYMFVTRQILQTTVKHTSVAVTTTRSTSTMTRHHGRDFMGTQQDFAISRQMSGRCGHWSGVGIRKMKESNEKISTKVRLSSGYNLIVHKRGF
jgi:hypothetical protein